MGKPLSTEQKRKAELEIFFNGEDAWDIYDCGWSGWGDESPSSSLYPDNGDRPNCNIIGHITCPCDSLVSYAKDTWADQVADLLTISLSGLNWVTSSYSSFSFHNSRRIKTYKSQLIQTKLNECIASVCDRCVQTTKTSAQGATCQKDWNYYN